jgi:hypothetical protein
VHEKTANDADGIARLRREADLLTAARHPGVVELAGFEVSDEQAVLRTVDVGPSLDQSGALPSERVAELVAAVATMVADLHSIGIVHGAIEAPHVLTASDGRPVLCSFSRAGRVGEQPPGAPGPLSPSDDVADLGALALALLDDDPLARLRGEPSLADAIRSVARTALDPDRAARPSAAQLAEKLRTAEARKLPTARVRQRQLAFLGASALLVVVGVALLLPGRHHRPATVTVAPAARVSPAAPLPKACPVVTTTLRADVDGDGCDDSVTFTDGLLSAAGLHFKIGEADDIAATGHWGCRPKATIALLRPDGDVALFDDWAKPGQQVTARLVGHVPGANQLRADDVNNDGCDEMVVTGPGLRPVVLHR